MRFLGSFVVTAMLAVLTLRDVARADVGQCWVLCVVGIEDQLDAKQQQEIGRRIMKAHETSGQSDFHIVFLCVISRVERGVLYRISETAVGAGKYPVHGYRLTAPDFDGMRHAVAEVEAAFKQSHIHKLKLGDRKKVLDAPRDEEGLNKSPARLGIRWNRQNGEPLRIRHADVR